MSPILLEDVRTFIRRFVVLRDAQADAVALWVAHTHVFDAFGVTPYLAITSPEKRSGKTRLLEVLELLAHEPLPTANISDAALFRVVAERSPTLLMDEVDAIFKSREREELRGLLNAGYRRGAVAHRMGGQNNRELQTFPVCCPKAFAGIGDCLPDTITDRAIPIGLKRRTRDEQIERFRLRDVEPTGHDLRDRLADWLEPQTDYLAGLRPDLPHELDDRAQDVTEPLLAIAELAAGDWPERATTAVIALATGEEREDDSLTVRLLRDIHGFFSSTGCDRVKTADLLASLHDVEESPWGDWYGKTLSAQGPVEAAQAVPDQDDAVKVDGETVRGYKAEQFSDAFARALSVTGVTGVTSRSASQAEGNAGNASNAYPPANGTPQPGDDGYLEFIIAAKRNGHLSHDEWREQTRLHRLVKKARA